MDKTLTIRYTSDTHGYLYPTNYADMQERPMGLMKLASEYPHDGNTLIIDGGDISISVFRPRKRRPA